MSAKRGLNRKFWSAFLLFWGFLLFSPILIDSNVVWTASRTGNSV